MVIQVPILETIFEVVKRGKVKIAELSADSV